MKAAYLKPGHVIRVGDTGERVTVREVKYTHKDAVAIRIRGRSPLYVRWDADFWVEGVDEGDPGDEQVIELHGDVVDLKTAAHNPAYDLAACQRAAIGFFSSPEYEAAVERVYRDMEARRDRERMGGAIAFITPERARAYFDRNVAEWYYRAAPALLWVDDAQEQAGVIADHDPGDEAADVAPERVRRREARRPFKFPRRKLF